jgi:hypothetical protein
VPFTFAHPAAALPLLRPLGRTGSLSALAIGSIAPDLDFIVPLGASRAQTHGLAALLTYSLPAGLLAYGLFHALLKAPLRALLPPAIAERLAVAEQRGTPWPAVLVSLLCGALTHLAWDAFTHPGTPVVMAIALLQESFATVGGYQVFGYKLLQHGGTLVGLALLARWFGQWMARTPLAPYDARLSARQRWLTIAVIAGVSTGAGLCAGVLRSAHLTGMAGVQAFAAGCIFTALPACALAITLYSLLWQARR